MMFIFNWYTNAENQLYNVIASFRFVRQFKALFRFAH